MMNAGKPAIFMTFRPSSALLARLNERFTVLHGKSPEVAGAARSSTLSGVRAAVTVGPSALSLARLDEMPNLELICAYGAGYDGLDLDYLRARRIALTNGPGNSACVADSAMMLLLAAARGLVAADRYVREGRWDRIPPTGLARADGLGGRHCGVFGLGAIGRQIAARAQAFDLAIGYHGRARQADAPYAYFDSLAALADWSDILFVACPLTKETHHAVDRGILDRLGAGGILVNIARGPVVDEAALIAALETGAIAGAGLDVFEHEPEVPQALRESPRVVLSPHVGGWTSLAMARIDDILMANLETLHDGGALTSTILPRPA